MKRLALFLLPVVVHALDNGVRHNNATAGAISSIPITTSHVFPPGQIRNYPRPYVLTTGGSRTAAPIWQANVLRRHRDATVVRSITAGRAGSPAWSVALGTLTDVVVAAGGESTATFPNPHGLQLADRLQVSGTPTTTGVNAMLALDNIMVAQVVSSTVVKYVSRFVNNSGAYFNLSSGSTYTTGVVITQKIDPQEPANACRLTSPDHGFYRGETVTVPNIMSGLTIVSPSVDNNYLVTGHTRDELVINAVCSGTGWTGGGSITGPANGSVMHAKISYYSIIPSAGSSYVDFVNSVTPSSAGNEAATLAAGLTKAGMLAMTWNAELVATAPVRTGQTAAITTSARAMLSASSFETVPSYCSTRRVDAGPVMTEMIVETGCKGALTDDFGWKIVPGSNVVLAVTIPSVQIAVASIANIEADSLLWFWTDNQQFETVRVDSIANPVTTCDGQAITAGPCLNVTRAITGAARAYGSTKQFGMFQWENATAPYKSLHPVFYLQFYPGQGVEIGVEVNNSYYSKIQNLWYAIDIRTGAGPASRYTKPQFKHTNSESWFVRVFDPPTADPQFFCSGGSGTDPDNCATTGGGTRTLRYLTDHNTPHLMTSKQVPEYQMWSGLTNRQQSTANGFDAGDRAAISSTGGALGQGTFGSQFDYTGSVAEKDFQGAQESYHLLETFASCLQAWNSHCYRIIYGTTNPGGGGNVEAQQHIPWLYIDDRDIAFVPGYVMPGFNTTADLSFGRAPSIYAWPTWVSGTGSVGSNTDHPIDKRYSACSDAAPRIIDTVPASNVSAAPYGWPCHWYASVGLDGWVIDQTHSNDWNGFAYLLDGHPRHLKMLHQQAAWMQGQHYNDPGRRRGRSWSQPENWNVQPRAQGGWTRAVMQAAIYTPNVPQFGFATPSVTAAYWMEKLSDLALAREGVANIRIGTFAKMYPHITLPATFAACPTDITVNDVIWIYTFCQHQRGENPLGIASGNAVASCGGGGTHEQTSCSPIPYSEVGWWYEHHAHQWYATADKLGFPGFRPTRERIHRLSMAMFGSANWNPWMNDLYQSPRLLNPGSGNRIVQTFTEMFDGLKVTWPSGARTDTDWCHQPAICEAPVSGYAAQWIPTLAIQADMQSQANSDIDGCAGGNCIWSFAWNWANTNIKGAIADQVDVLKFNMLPNSAPRNLSCVVAGGGATCTYLAPDANACLYRVGTEFADSLDSGDTSDGGSAAGLRTVNLTGLASHSTYQFRVKCGQVVSGASNLTAMGVTQFDSLGGESLTIGGRVTGNGRIRTQ